MENWLPWTSVLIYKTGISFYRQKITLLVNLKTSDRFLKFIDRFQIEFWWSRLLRQSLWSQTCHMRYFYKPQVNIHRVCVRESVFFSSKKFKLILSKTKSSFSTFCICYFWSILGSIFLPQIYTAPASLILTLTPSFLLPLCFTVSCCGLWARNSWTVQREKRKQGFPSFFPTSSAHAFPFPCVYFNSDLLESCNCIAKWI